MWPWFSAPPSPRAACEQQAVTLTLQEDRASLTLSGGPLALELDSASRCQAQRQPPGCTDAGPGRACVQLELLSWQVGWGGEPPT